MIWPLIAIIAVLLLVWAAINLQFSTIEAKPFGDLFFVEIRVATASIGIVALFALFRFPMKNPLVDLRWIGAGLATELVLKPVLDLATSDAFPTSISNEVIVSSWMVTTIGGAFLWVGVAMTASLPLARSTAKKLLLVAGIVGVITIVSGLLSADAVRRIVSSPHSLGFAVSLILVAILPITSVFATFVDRTKRQWRDYFGSWLNISVIALWVMILLDICWQASNGRTGANGDILRLAAASLIAVSGVSALRKLADEQSSLLFVERANVARLSTKLDRSSDHFAMVTHELTAPIAAIRAYADLLEMPDLDAAMRSQGLAAIFAETRVLDTLVSDARLAATVERPDFAVHPFPIRADLLMADTAGYARTLPKLHPFTYTCHVRDRIMADPDRMGQVLRNLLLNAWKHTPIGTPIELRASSDAEQFYIDVIDRGEGIPADEIDRIFEKFQRGAGERPAGLGLGLFVARRLAEAHGGTISVVSTPGRGTVFTVTLKVIR